MKIYFCGSILGDTSHKDFYKQIIPWLEQNYGEVLTRHIISGDPSNVPGKKYSDDPAENVFLRDDDWMRRCDVVIADLSAPSLGVGGEIVRNIYGLQKPVLAIYDATKTVSLYITGILKSYGGQISTDSNKTTPCYS